jgi:hypothetical protein
MMALMETTTDRIATLSAVVSERHKTLAKSERRLADAERGGWKFVSCYRAMTDTDTYDRLIDAALDNMPHRPAEYVGDNPAVWPEGTIAVWHCGDSDRPKMAPLRSFDVALTLYQEHPGDVEWFVMATCQVCHRTHVPSEPCDCGALYEPFAESHKLVEELRSLVDSARGALLSHDQAVEHLSALRHNLAYVATLANEAADQANERLVDLLGEGEL